MIVDVINQNVTNTSTPAQVLMYGAVGSTLAGIDTDTSDVDRMAVYAYNNETTIRSSVISKSLNLSFFHKDPDVFAYEVARFAELILKTNVPVMNFIHSESFEHADATMEDIVALTRQKFVTLDMLTRVYPATAKSSFEDSLRHAEKHEVPDETSIADAPKHTARKLKVAFVQLEQAIQALETGVFTPLIENKDFFLNQYRSLTYQDAKNMFQERYSFAKTLTNDSFPKHHSDEAVDDLTELVFRAKDF